MALSEDLGEQPQQLAVWSSFPHFPMGKKTHSQTQISVKNSSWKWIFTCQCLLILRKTWCNTWIRNRKSNSSLSSSSLLWYRWPSNTSMIYHDLPWCTMIYLFCLLIFHGKLWNPQVPSRYRCEKKPSWFSWWSPNIVFCKPKNKAIIWDDCYHPYLYP
jgi:hypothetical protein